MEVTVRLFAMLRERAGASQVTLELPEGARVSDALAELSDIAEGLPLVMAVNREYAKEDHPLDAGDELALIPPVSGGEAAVQYVHVVLREGTSADQQLAVFKQTGDLKDVVRYLIAETKAGVARRGAAR